MNTTRINWESQARQIEKVVMRLIKQEWWWTRFHLRAQMLGWQLRHANH